MVLETLVFSPFNQLTRLAAQEFFIIVCYFVSDHELKEAMHMWLATQPRTFFPEAYKSLFSVGLSVFKNFPSPCTRVCVLQELFNLLHIYELQGFHGDNVDQL
jgi:hypothetical protein